jgi:hypothetical protein
MITKLISLFMIALACLGLAGCDSSDDTGGRLDDIAGPYSFSILSWEISSIPGILAHTIFDSSDATEVEEVSLVKDYFSIVAQGQTVETQLGLAISRGDDIQIALLKQDLDKLQAQQAGEKDTVEKVLEKQIKTVLKAEGIANPWSVGPIVKLNFPPVIISLEAPPHLLVVAPRNAIATMRTILLEQDLSAAEIQCIEVQSDALGFSSLVVDLGGVATYPAFVVAKDGLSFALNVAAEEWSHQYMLFRPQGFRYALHVAGLYNNHDVATIAETTASIMGQEIGELVYKRYYASSFAVTPVSPPQEPTFNFNVEMRRIRMQVDDYLLQGQINGAEQYMEAQRRYLADNGYYIRKLNQAYFAFYGTYANSPTSVDPVGPDLVSLRQKSASLKEFVDTVGLITSRSDLQTAAR